MHIPAMDSLRHERVGIVSDDDAILVLQAYVETEDTEERGAYDPIEGMARPFPLMMNSGGSPRVVEPLVESKQIDEFSEGLVEYVSLLYESMRDGDWVDELDEFDESQFSPVEQQVASSLLGFASQEPPRTLWRTVYEKATELTGSDTPSQIIDNPLRDISNRERYSFDYLPSMDEVDEWELLQYSSEQEVEETGEVAVSESLWIRYSTGDSTEERPLVAYQNEVAGLSAQSPSVEYGTEGESDVDEEMIRAMLSDASTSKSRLGSVSIAELQGTKTERYLEAFLAQD